MVTIGETEHTLQKLGRKTFRVPHGWIDVFPPDLLRQLGTRQRFLIPMDHADTQVLHLSKENALFFDEAYYREHYLLLDRIVREVRPDIFGLLPYEDGLPINSLPLPDGGVYMDQAARESTDILRQAGIRVEVSSRPFGPWAWGSQAGIHCATNTVYLPA
jgi:hypothetical protein